MKTIAIKTISLKLLLLFIFTSSHVTWAKSIAHIPWHSPDQIQLKTKLSQTKIVQQGANTVFLDITFVPPVVNNKVRQRATDIIIVLDRSGSMSEAKNEINAYRKEVEAAAIASNLSLATPEMKGKLEEMERA